MAVQYDPIAKDESLNTTEVSPRNIADVLAEELSGIASALTPAQLNSLSDVTITSAQDGQTLKYDSVSQKWVNANDAGGHTIENPSGTSMTQRANMQFTGDGVSVTDDAVNGKTIVDVSPDAGDIAYDNTTSGLTATEVQSAIDEVDGTLDRFTNAVAIPANADLNNYTTPGTYYSPNDATTQSLTNCPVPQYSFEMNVFKWASGAAQFIHGYERAYFRRGTSDSWSTLARTDVNNNFTENQTIDKKNGTTSAVANSMFSIGNNIPQGTDKNSRGILGIFSNTAKISLLWAATDLASDINVYLPSKGGTLATTDEAIYFEEWNGTTTSSGALMLPSKFTESANRTRVVNIVLTSHKGLAIYRTDGYAQCYDLTFQALASTAVTVRVFYMKL